MKTKIFSGSSSTKNGRTVPKNCGQIFLRSNSRQKIRTVVLKTDQKNFSSEFSRNNGKIASKNGLKIFLRTIFRGAEFSIKWDKHKCRINLHFCQFFLRNRNLFLFSLENRLRKIISYHFSVRLLPFSFGKLPRDEFFMPFLKTIFWFEANSRLRMILADIISMS